MNVLRRARSGLPRHQARAGLGEGVEISHMLDDLERQHGVETLAVRRQRLGRGVAG